MIDQFTKKDFENALENISFHHKLHWKDVKVNNNLGEYIYRIPMPNGLVVVIHSSISPRTNLADESGENSIRVWIQNPLTLKPVLPKFQNWITRVLGWDQRLEQMIVKFMEYTENIEFCNHCKQYEQIFTVRKEGKNKGRLFKTCGCPDEFTWITYANGELVDDLYF